MSDRQFQIQDTRSGSWYYGGQLWEAFDYSANGPHIFTGCPEAVKFELAVKFGTDPSELHHEFVEDPGVVLRERLKVVRAAVKKARAQEAEERGVLIAWDPFIPGRLHQQRCQRQKARIARAAYLARVAEHDLWLAKKDWALYQLEQNAVACAAARAEMETEAKRIHDLVLLDPIPELESNRNDRADAVALALMAAKPEAEASMAAQRAALRDFKMFRPGVLAALATLAFVPEDPRIDPDCFPPSC